MEDLYGNLYIIEEFERRFCPECRSELIYEASYDGLDLVMFCTNCYYKGIVRDSYKDNEDYEV